ncbi:MAG TPA: (d)CMP kinase [Thermohalobaculum sp.]|nr:(d)CMP kinase [Thermohalobaculum sp.]
MRFVIALDGPAAAGKGTVARALAATFGFAYLDTGTLYRAVGLKTLEAGGSPLEADAAELARTLRTAELDAPGLRTATVAEAASKVAAMPAVRAALVEFQRDFARRDGGAVLDGRDIGTVICPDADVKLFVTASAEERARRRHAELVAAGDETPYERVLDEVRARDERDAGRAEAPLARARDAHLLDTTELSIDAAVARAAEIVGKALDRKRG